MNSAEVLRIGERLGWQLRAIWERLGTPEMLLLAATALWAGLQWQVIAPLQQVHAELVEVREQLARAEAVTVPSKDKDIAVSRDPLREFVSAFPLEVERERQVDRLHALAEAKGLAIDRIDYRQESLEALPLVRLGLRISSTGSYEAQRAFLHAVLQVFGNAVVDRINLEKEKDSTQLRVSLDIGLYYRKAS